MLPASPPRWKSPEAIPTPEQELSERARLWIADITYLREQYKRAHVDPFYYCSEEEFDWRLDRVAAKVDELSDSDISYELQAVLSGMGDFHTSLVVTDSLCDERLPIFIECFGESFCITGLSGRLRAAGAISVSGDRGCKRDRYFLSLKKR